MAKYKKKYYTKKKVLKAISNYTRTKLNYVTDFYIDEQNNWFIDGQQSGSLIIGEVLSGNTSEFQNLGKQYAFVKLRGVYMEVVPIVRGGRYNTGICLGNTNDLTNFGNIRTQPNILLISWNTKSKMYKKISSEFTSTNDIQLFNNVALLPFSQGNGAARFSIKITLYLTFKTNV